MCGVQSRTRRRKEPGLCHFLRSAAAGHPGCARRGQAAQHIVSRRGDAARRAGSEGGARLPDWNPLSPPLGRPDPAGGGGRAGVGGRGARRQRRHPDCSTGALRQAAARRTPARRRSGALLAVRAGSEIELFHSFLGLPGARGGGGAFPGVSRGRALPPQPKAIPARTVGAHTVSAAGSSRGGCERRGLSLGSAARCTGSGDPQPAVPGLRLERGSSETVRRYQIVSSARVESANPLEVLGDNEFLTAVQSSE